MKKILLFLVISVFTNCTNTKSDEFENSFASTTLIKLASKPVILNNTDLFFSHLFEMKYVDDLLIISDPSEFYNMKIVDIKQKTVVDFAKRGRGPNEMNSQSSWYSIDYNKKRLYVTDGFNFYFYAISDLKRQHFKPIETLKPRFTNDNFFGSTAFCGGYIIGGMFEKKIGIYNIEKKILVRKFDYLNEDGAFLSQAKYYNHPTKNLVCSQQSKSAVMSILKIENNDIKVKEFSWWTSDGTVKVEGQKKSFEPKVASRNGFITAAVTQKYIYSLYSGKVINASSVNELTKAFLSKYIYVSDWEGNPVMRYELDQEVRSIAVDEKNNILYAASYLEGDPKLVQYKLK